MATIALYAGKINQMPRLISDVKKSVDEYKSELFSLKKMALSVSANVCHLDDVVSSIQTSTQTQEEKINALQTFSENIKQFTEYTACIDGKVADMVNQRKDDFFATYYYLKPDCEKNGWEKFCDGLAFVGEWCKEHWKLIVVVVLVIVAVAVIICTAGMALGPLLTIVAGACKGLLMGALIGGAMGGLSSMANGGSFLDGFEDGAFTGAITGALMGGLGGLGQVAGNSIKCVSALGKTISVISKVSGALTMTMGGFDMLSFGIGIFDPNNALVKFNQKLHSSALYNGFQFTVGALAVFSAGAASTMKCFVAGTLIATTAGFIAIERIVAGDKVISTNAETFEVAEKSVVETYIRETNELVQLTIGGEFIKSTPDHPFYVKDAGFVKAAELCIGDKLIDSGGNVLTVEDTKFEKLDELVTVYNFQVEDFHTYHVGQWGVLVHNAEYQNAPYHTNKDSARKNKSPQNGQQALDDSLSLGENTGRRIAVSDNEFVVLDQTSGAAFPGGVFHGHVRSWAELTPKMQAILRKSGLVTKGGKII